MSKDPDNNRIEDDLADSIAEAWANIQDKAAKENPGEMQKATETLQYWVAKLEELLKPVRPK